MKRWVLVLAVVPVVALITSCGSTTQGSSATSQWVTGKDVLDSLKKSNFACDWTGPGDQIQKSAPLISNPEDEKSQTTVTCGQLDSSFTVMFSASGQDVVEQMRSAFKGCKDLTAADMTDSATNWSIVLGKNFLVFSASGGFPPNAQPEDFVKAFGGEKMNALDLYKRVCPEVKVPQPSGSSL